MIKILVVGPSWIGDTVLAQPLFKRLHERHPNLVLDVLAPPWTLPLLSRMPEVDTVITNPFRHGEMKLLDRFRLGRHLRERGYHQAIILPNSLKSALIPMFAAIPLRTGFVGEMRRGLLNDARRLDKKAFPLMVERYAQLAEKHEGVLKRPLPLPQLQVSDPTRQATLQKLGLKPLGPVAVFCPGAEYGPAKRWLPGHFAHLAGKLRGKGYEVWLAGSAKEQELGEQIRRQCDGACINLCGRTSLDEAIDVLASASVVVTNDSGLMHVAAALNKPMVALYGSSSPEFTPPLSPQARVLKLDLPCSPCFKRECPLGHFHCMTQLTAEEVFANIPP